MEKYLRKLGKNWPRLKQHYAIIDNASSDKIKKSLSIQSRLKIVVDVLDKIHVNSLQKST